MLGNYWNGLVNLVLGLTTVMVVGLDTASKQGAGWSSLDSASSS